MTKKRKYTIRCGNNPDGTAILWAAEAFGFRLTEHGDLEFYDWFPWPDATVVVAAFAAGTWQNVIADD